jgi:aminoglycoside phosphotransferase (APT) family kinase protein
VTQRRPRHDDEVDVVRRAAASAGLGREVRAEGVQRRTGEFHDVLLVPPLGVVKVARGRAALHLARRAALLARLSGLGLPFAVPRPLGEVARGEGDLAAVVLSWVPGEPRPSSGPDGPRLRSLLDALAAVRAEDLDGLLDEPHAYAGRSRWPELMRDEVVPRLPAALRAAATDRVRAALELAPVPAGLVHGDLAGDNLRWDGPRLVGVLDWDLAAAWDPCVDLACLSWFGWGLVESIATPDHVHRARTWAATFALEQVAAAIDNGEGPAVVQQRVERAAGVLAAAEHV